MAAVWGKITHLRENFQNSSIQVQHSTPIDVFDVFSEFHADLSDYKEKRLHCTHYKTPTFWPPFCAPLVQGAKILTREI